jgi:hypothetical protein
MVPAVAFPPEIPFTLQLTAVFDVPVTVAVSCCVLPSNTLELDDETLTVTDWGGPDEPPPPAQPPKRLREASEQRGAMTAMVCAQRERRAGEDTRSRCVALAFVMLAPLLALPKG